MYEFSFIIPVYNVEDCLKRCVKSVVNQKYDSNKIEVILVDDGSTDQSGKICDALSKRYENVFVFHKKNGGLSDARNYGLKKASKEYIIFLDSDDYVTLDTCKKFNDILLEVDGKCDIITGGVVKHVAGRKENWNTFNLPVGVISGKEFLKNRLQLGKWYVAAWSSIYRKNFLIENDLKFAVGMLHEDEEFSPRAFLLANKVACLSSFFYHYIIRENSITTSKNKIKNAKDIFSICKCLDGIYENISDLELRRLLMTHSAKISFRAIEEGKLYLKENRYLIDEKLLRKNCISKKEKIRYRILKINPVLLHICNQISNKE